MSETTAQAFNSACDLPIARQLTPRPRLGWRRSFTELFALMAAIWCADLLLYQHGTFAGWSIMLICVALALPAIKLRRIDVAACAVVGVPLIVLSLKLLWCGSVLQIVCGLVLLSCLSMTCSGVRPWLPEGMLYLPYLMVGAAERILMYGYRSAAHKTETTPGRSSSQLLATLIPILVVSVFSSLFVMANPDLLSSLKLQFNSLATWIGNYCASISVAQFIFWCVSGWTLLGLAYPRAIKMWDECKPAPTECTTQATMYSAARNSLLSVTVLFAIYLGFEFMTLGFRELPDDFYYAGYAHEGAFWLTVALGLSTLTLSMIFRGTMLADVRLKQLKRLAWIWSAQNLILSLAVVNRMTLYINYNGMTRMRVIGLLGIAAVVAGFIMVVVKIIQGRSFAWLIHRQMWCPLVAVLLFAILPVDWLVNRFNARRVANGQPAASVQIVAHLTSAEGVLPLFALVDHDTEEIREGVRAILAKWAIHLDIPGDAAASDPSAGDSDLLGEVWRAPLGHSSPWANSRNGISFASKTRHTKAGWLSMQFAEQQLAKRLRSTQKAWQPYAKDAHLRHATINAFFKHTYQWY